MNQKLDFIKVLDSRVKTEPLTAHELLSKISDGKIGATKALLHHRVKISGRYDFEHEMALRNRRFQGIPGLFLLTPLKIDKSDYYILVNRGFIPIRDQGDLKKFNKNSRAEFVGLLKESVPQKFLAPPDPQIKEGEPFIVQWLRPNIPEIQKQLPYKLLPMWVEIIGATEDLSKIDQKVILSSKSGREEMLFLPGGDENKVLSEKDIPNLNFPVPVFDTVVSPGRHREYVYEWAVMALLTIMIGVIIQLKRQS